MMSLFWRGKKVFVTGHTGFKGSWLTLWLQKLGADVTGYSQQPPTEPSLFELARVNENMVSLIGDIRDYDRLLDAIRASQPEIIFHMAAQALVRKSYLNPIDTFSTNIMGTVHLLEAVRHTDSVRVVVNVTSDKCYENKDWVWGYREDDPMGGYDPYSSSKGCAELVSAAFWNSFFKPQSKSPLSVALATARAGNVIGGGDWAEDRLVPDIIRSILNSKPVIIRNPSAVRPWQHVLDPLNGYMILAENLWDKGDQLCGGWNFGPSDSDTVQVGELTERIIQLWGDNAQWLRDEAEQPHEANYLKLDCSKARQKLGWRPKLTLASAIEWTVEWYRMCARNEDVRKITLEQIENFGESRKELL